MRERSRPIATHLASAAFAAVVFLAAAGCGGDSSTGTGGNDYNPVIVPADFVATIDNPLLPYTAGKVFTYVGDAESIVVEVTSERKEILGVDCIVVRDRVWEEGELVEDTYDWYAQDKNGNVWYFGEDTKELEEGVVVSTEGSWEAGVDDAKPGILMKGNPQVGDEYRQEFYEDEAEDMARVVGVGESVTIGIGTYANCARIREWTPLEPSVAEEKYYAPGVGPILEVVVQGGSGRIELVSLTP